MEPKYSVDWDLRIERNNAVIYITVWEDTKPVWYSTKEDDHGTFVILPNRKKEYILEAIEV